VVRLFEGNFLKASATSLGNRGSRIDYFGDAQDRVLTHVKEGLSSEITHVIMRHNFMYLTAVIDWFSRYVLAWRLSNTLEGQFRPEAFNEVLTIRGQRPSTATRVRSSLREIIPAAWRRPGSRCAGTVGGVRWTMCSWSDCGGA
jgi:putative transposase